MNTVSPPHLLKDNEAQEITNFYYNGQGLVGRFGYTAVCDLPANHHPITSVIPRNEAVPTAKAALITTQITGLSQLHLPASHLRRHNAGDAGLATSVFYLDLKSTNNWRVSIVSNPTLNTKTDITGGNIWHHVMDTPVVEYKNSVYGLQATVGDQTTSTGTSAALGQEGLLYRWAGDTRNLGNAETGGATITASCTATLGSTTVNYTALSPASTDISNLIMSLSTSTAGLTYQVKSQTVATTTTGSFVIDVAWREANVAAVSHGFESISRCQTQANLCLSLPAPASYSGQAATAITDYRERLFMGTHLGYLIWSKPGEYDNFPASNFVNTGLGIVTGIIKHNNSLFVFGQDKFIILTGYDEGTFTFSDIIDNYGCIDPNSFVILAGTLYWATTDGYYSYTNGGVVSVSEPITSLWKSNFYTLAAITPTGYGIRNTYTTGCFARAYMNRWILISIWSDYRQEDLYNLMYDTKYDAWSQWGNQTQGVSEQLHSPYKVKHFGEYVALHRVLGVTPTAICDLSPMFESTNLIDGSSLQSRATFPGYGRDYTVVSGPGQQSITYSCVTKAYELVPTETVRIHEALIAHSGQHLTTGTGTTVPTTGTLNIWRDTDTYFYGFTGVNDITPTVALTGTQFPYRITGSTTKYNPRTNQLNRILVSNLPLECNTIVFEWRVVNATTQSFYHHLGSIWVRYEPTRQFRVQD